MENNFYVILGPGLAQREDFSDARRYCYCCPLPGEKKAPSLGDYFENINEVKVLNEGNSGTDFTIQEIIRKEDQKNSLALFPLEKISNDIKMLIDRGFPFIIVSPTNCECSGLKLNDEKLSALDLLTCADIEKKEPNPQREPSYKKCEEHRSNFRIGNTDWENFIKSQSSFLFTYFDKEECAPVFSLSSAIDISRWHKFYSSFERNVKICALRETGASAGMLARAQTLVGDHLNK